MLKKYFLYTLAVVATLMTAGCADDLTVEPEGVMLQLEITDVSPGVSTRAVPADLPKPVQELFHLAIASDESGRTVYDDTFAPSVGPFAPGRFTLSVDCGDDVLALDAPRYAGSATASIYKGMENIISIEARVANALMSIAYQADGREELDEVFESYGVTFTLDDKEVSLNGPTPAQSAYFPAGSVPRVTFHAVRKDDGREVSTSLDAALAARLPLEAGQHAKVTLGVNADRVTITKVDIEEVTINQTIPPSWLPRPKATVSGFDADGNLRNVETNTTGEVKLDFTTSSALQDVELTLDIQDPGFAHLAGTHLLSQMSAQQIEALRTAGIELPAIGSESGTITLTRFATNLQTDKGATTTNTLSLRVKANDRWDTESPQTYSIVVEKPVFGARVLPGNIWTREFTISPLRAEDVTKGNFDVLNQRIVYQLQRPDGTWKSFTGRDQKNLTPGTSYTIRAYLREGIYSEPVTVTTFVPTALQNGSLDAWEEQDKANGQDVTSGAYGTGHGRRFAFSGWTTLNELTTYHTYKGLFTSQNLVYTSRSATRPTGENDTKYLPTGYSDDAVNGSAVWLGTIGWGVNSSMDNTKFKTQGQLYLGTITDVNGGMAGVGNERNEYTPHYGIGYGSHPTHLSFYYKYKGQSGDQAPVEIGVYHDDILLGECKKNLGDQNPYKQENLEIVYDQSEDKLTLMPNKLVVRFTSGTSSEVSKVSAGSFCNYHTGSQLWIDEVSLLYDK